MPEREDYATDYAMPLHPWDRGCWLRMRISTRRGRVIGFVVQLEAEINGQTYPVVRYDCAHGQPHRDILDSVGAVIAKELLPFSYDHALDHAERDIRQHWQDYHQDFIRRMP